MSDRRLFSQIQEQLSLYGASVVSTVELNGNNHPCFKFRLPSGKVLRWVMPNGRRDDLRAEKNNLSQLKQLLRRETTQ